MADIKFDLPNGRKAGAGDKPAPAFLVLRACQCGGNRSSCGDSARARLVTPEIVVGQINAKSGLEQRGLIAFRGVLLLATKDDNPCGCKSLIKVNPPPRVE